MKLEDIMKTDVVSTHPGETAEGAWQLMQVKSCHHLIVVDDSGVAGIVSQRDLGGPHAADFRRDKVVRELMAKDVVTVTPGTTLHEAADLMRGRTIGCLPVMEAGRLCGIVTVTDLLKILAASSE